MTLVIHNDLLLPLNAHIQKHGVADCEAGGFFLGLRETPIASVLALAEGRGVERHRGVFRLSGMAIEALFEWADAEGLRVWAQVHSHPRGSFLSPTDARDGFRVTGFLSAVVPNFANPPTQPSSWRFWRFTGGAWKQEEPAAVVVGAGKIVEFDEEGVR